MEAIGEAIKAQFNQKKYQALTQEILTNPEIQNFIKQHQLSDWQINKSFPKFNEYLKEKAKFVSGQVTKIEGYEPILSLTEGFADVIYRPTPETFQKEVELEKKRRVKLFGMPKEFSEIIWTDFIVDNQSRDEVDEYLTSFIEQYPNKKGLYLYGDFGVGKSFILAAMAKNLADKNIATTMIHYPTFIADMDYDTVKVRVDEVKKSPILVIDDIGAELNNAWVRDGILLVILEHRMQENLPTFFTSNLRMAELEQHLATTKKGEETWSAKRVMERVRKLSVELRLIGRNRRNG
jgi:primosomal protein DnaI